ncbi:MAG: hypothetical protein JSR59_21710 [Proteobacteria bacterium]|nr:hypothetical protein [Pseudomonadota bacterium]
MERDFSESGVINVNGQWATAVRFVAAFDGGSMTRVTLRFSNGRSVVATADLVASEARSLLGERNFAGIAKVAAKIGAAAAQGEGELRGTTLAYRQIALPGNEAVPPNIVEVDERTRIPEPAGQRHGMPGTPVEPAAGTPPSEPSATSEAGESSSFNAAPSPATPVPAWVLERFLEVDNRYYFRDRTLAFTDGGDRLKSETDNPEVVRGLIEIAQLRGWASVKVSGSEAFRRQVWREAELHGIGVKGYAPSDVEREELRRAEHRPSRGEMPVQEAANAPSAPDVPTKEGPRARHAGPMLTGVLMESGAAPYRFDRNEGVSYYVRVATAHGERVLWGIDLERALVESATQVKVGDEVGIENLGSRPVTVKSLKRDADGKVTDARIATHRNRWLIEKPSYFDERAERAEAFRNGQAARRELEARYPDLTGAIVSLWLGEQFADRLIERPEDRERVVALVKERIAQALERGEAVDAPRLRQEVSQRLQVIGDDFDEIGQRARARTAQRGAREYREQERDVPPQVLA